MEEVTTFAVTGDCIINRRISMLSNQRFLSLMKVIQDADVGYTHLETLIHNYDEPEVYPCAEPGFTSMRSPRFVADELKWAGFDIVSHASNHSLDYSYGGIMETLKTMAAAGIPCAGTGMDLGAAREAVYLDTTRGRVALISMCSSFIGWARAGEARRDMKGRPGLNPLRFHYVVDGESIKLLRQIAVKMGWFVEHIGNMWLFSPAASRMAYYKFIESDQSGWTTAVDESDAVGNLRSIKDARRQADWVLVHLHTHEFDPDKGLAVPAKFCTAFARDCIDAGADMFIGQGSHAYLRGIEVYRDRPIFYDPGDFMAMIGTVSKLSSDSYLRPGYGPEIYSWEATPADCVAAREGLPMLLNPPGGIRSAKVLGAVVAVAAFNADRKLAGIKLYPFTLTGKPYPKAGIPLLESGEMARKIIEYLGELSAAFDTKVEFKDGIGLVRPGH